MEVMLDGGRLRFGERLAVSLHRTLRIPEDGRTYPLPPGFGLFPVRLSRGEGADAALLVPMYQREALWLGFSAAPWKPNALKVICGGINAVSGIADDGTGLGEKQDYLVCPTQPWLDGFIAGDGVIRQFVAMPLGQGYAVEAAEGGPERGGIRIVAFEPKPGRFPDEPPPARPGPVRFSRPAEAEPREMALGAGGRMRQKIYPDPFGRDVWDSAETGRIEIRLLNSRRWREIVGEHPPPTPIDVDAYMEAGLPWFEIYDEGEGTVAPNERRRLKTIGERDAERAVVQATGIPHGKGQDEGGAQPGPSGDGTPPDRSSRKRKPGPRASTRRRGPDPC
jgi:hypothetical protein